MANKKQQREPPVAPPPPPDTFFHWLPREILQMIDDFMDLPTHAWNIFLAWNLDSPGIVARRLGWGGLRTKSGVIKRLLNPYCRLCGGLARNRHIIPYNMGYNNVCVSCIKRKQWLGFDLMGTNRARRDVMDVLSYHYGAQYFIPLEIMAKVREAAESVPCVMWKGEFLVNVVQVFENFFKLLDDDDKGLKLRALIEQSYYYMQRRPMYSKYLY